MEKRVIVKPEAGMVIVLLMDKYGDVVGKGVSKCHADDTFDAALGEKLANTRAWIKYYKLANRRCDKWVDLVKENLAYYERMVKKYQADKDIVADKLATLEKEYDEMLQGI